MQRMAPDLPQDYLNQLQQLTSIGAVVLTIALDRQLLRDNTYWVNVPKTGRACPSWRWSSIPT